MPIKRIKRKIEQLRKEPEPVRMRAAVLMTAVSGGLISVLWITLFLPIQLGHWRGDDGDREYPEDILVEAASGFSDSLGVAVSIDDNFGEVSGVEDKGDGYFKWPENAVPAVEFSVESVSPSPTASVDEIGGRVEESNGSGIKGVENSSQ